MVTQLYGDNVNAPPVGPSTLEIVDTVEAAGRAPVSVERQATGAPLATAEVPATGEVPATAEVPGPSPASPPTSPTWPTPSPWVVRRRAPEPFAIRGMVLGVVAAAVVLAGLATFSVALVWSDAMTRFAQIALMFVGGYLIACGVAYVTAAEPELA